MNIDLKIYNTNSQPFPAGATFALLAAGKVLTTAITDASGTARFVTNGEVAEPLSVRLVELPLPSGGLPEWLRRDASAPTQEM